MALLRDAHLGCAVTWQGKVDEYRLCVRFPRVCVRVRACLDLCFPVKEYGPACDRACEYQQECFYCQSKGQLVIWSAASPVVVTAADCHEERCRMRGMRVQEEEGDCGVGLSGTPQWSQYGKNTKDSTRISHEPLFFQPLSRPFRSVRDTKIWMNAKSNLNYEIWD